MQEVKTEHRISNIMKELHMTSDEVRSVYYAFDKLLVLKKHLPQSYIAKNRVSFHIDFQKDREYIAKMRWINEFMRSKGYPEDIFRNVEDFDTSMDDYDYYNEYKTPTQYRLDEEARQSNA